MGNNKAKSITESPLDEIMLINILANSNMLSKNKDGDPIWLDEGIISKITNWFCEIESNEVYKKNIEDKVQDSENQYKAELKFWKIFYNEMKYSQLQSYLFLPIIRYYLKYVLKFYQGNFLIIEGGKSHYPHLEDKENSLKIPFANQLVENEEDRLYSIIKLMNYSSNSFKERIKKFLDSENNYFKIIDKRAILKIVEDISVGSIKEDINKIITESKCEDFKGIKDEQKKWAINGLFSETFDYEMMNLVGSNISEMENMGEIGKTKLEKELDCILVEDGEASFAIYVEEMNNCLREEKKSETDFIEDFKVFLKVNKYIQDDGSITDKYRRMAKWIQKVIKYEEYKNIISKEPWTDIMLDTKSKNFLKKISGKRISDDIRNISGICNDLIEEGKDRNNYFRASGSKWQKIFRRCTTKSVHILQFSILEEGKFGVSWNFIGLFDFGDGYILEDKKAQKLLKQRISQSQILFTNLGRIAVEHKLEERLGFFAEQAQELEQRSKKLNSMLSVLPHGSWDKIILSRELLIKSIFNDESKLAKNELIATGKEELEKNIKVKKISKNFIDGTLKLTSTEFIAKYLTKDFDYREEYDISNEIVRYFNSGSIIGKFSTSLCSESDYDKINEKFISCFYLEAEGFKREIKVHLCRGALYCLLENLITNSVKYNIIKDGKVFLEEMSPQKIREREFIKVRIDVVSDSIILIYENKACSYSLERINEKIKEQNDYKKSGYNKPDGTGFGIWLINESYKSLTKSTKDKDFQIVKLPDNSYSNYFLCYKFEIPLK